MELANEVYKFVWTSQLGRTSIHRVKSFGKTSEDGKQIGVLL
jgi:hypothetical protein